MHDKIQVVVVDDHPLLREGVASTLAASPNIEVVGQGDTAEDAIRLARDLLPEIILLDISMKGGGLKAARKIAAAFPVVKIVMLTVSEREEDVVASLKAGARGSRHHDPCISSMPRRAMANMMQDLPSSATG